MESYEIGTRVPTRQLRVGDRLGENVIELIRPGDDNGEDSEYLTPVSIRVTGGAWYTAEARGRIVVPDNHSVVLDVDRHGNPVLQFHCRTYQSPCSQQCTRCGRIAWECDCPEGTGSGWRLVGCRYLAYLHSLDARGIIGAYDGALGALHSGPVMLTPDTGGPGCRWRYPDRFAAFIGHTDTGIDPDKTLARFGVLRGEIDAELDSHDPDHESPGDCAVHHDCLEELYREANDLMTALDTHLRAGGRLPRAWAAVHR